VIAVMLGIGFSLELSNAVGFIADFLKMYGTSGGFVWGFISFFDKASSGIALFIITVIFNQNAGDLGDSLYIRICVVGVPLAASIVGVLMTFLVDLQTPHKKSIVRSFVKNQES
jgi:hypothetical protein